MMECGRNTGKKCLTESLIVIIERAGKIIKPGYEGMIANLELLLELNIIEILDRVAIGIVENVVKNRLIID